MFGRLQIAVFLCAAVALGSCTPTRTCEGDDCSCSADDDCIIGCAPAPELRGCDCTNGWPIGREGHEDEEDCGVTDCAAAMCGDWTEYEARCSFGRCVGVPVGDHP